MAKSIIQKGHKMLQTTKWRIIILLIPIFIEVVLFLYKHISIDIFHRQVSPVISITIIVAGFIAIIGLILISISDTKNTKDYYKKLHNGPK